MGRFIRPLAALVIAAVLVVAFAVSAQAAAPYGWTYSYSGYKVGGGGWEYVQDTTRAARHWPSPGYTTSSTYYRLGSSLSTVFKSRSRTAAGTWSAADPMFHFYELPLGSDQYDHTLGMNDSIQYPALNVADQRWDSAKNRAYVYNWYLRFRTSLTPFGMYWVDGSTPDGADILSVATHELGHSVVLEDLQGSWNDTDRPTMYSYVMAGNLSARTLAAGDIYGISNLY